MDAVEFIKKYSCLCNIYKNCTECPFRESPCGTDYDWTLGIEEKIVEIVQQWSQFHPQKTMMQDFFEKFPNAPKDEKEGGVPKLVCPKQLGYTDIKEDCIELFDGDCVECWGRPLEE